MSESRSDGLGWVYRIAGVLGMAGCVWLFLRWGRLYVRCRGFVFPAEHGFLLTAALALVGTFVFFAVHTVSRWRRRLRLPASVIGFFGVPLTLVMWLGLEFAATVGWSTINPERYEELRTRHSERWTKASAHDSVGHFPLTIPANATNVHFFHNKPQFFGGDHLQLRVTLPRAEVEALLEKYGPLADAKCDCGTELGWFVREHCFYTLDENARMELPAAPFPDSYQFLYLGPSFYPVTIREGEAQPCTRCGDGGAWRYGYGLAIDLEACDVVFWAAERVH